MGQHDIEVILMRQLAGHLVVPVLVVNLGMDIVYYNEAAEEILGLRFAETGKLSTAEAREHFLVLDAAGSAIPPKAGPIYSAMRDKHAHTRDIVLQRVSDGRQQAMQAVAFPLLAQGDRELGTVCMLWVKP